MPNRIRVPNLPLILRLSNGARDTRPRPRPSDLPDYWPDFTPEPVTHRDLRARPVARPDRPWTNIVEPPPEATD